MYHVIAVHSIRDSAEGATLETWYLINSVF